MAKVRVIIGLGFGDEGKGSCVDYNVRAHEADLIVRFNGGAQCAHAVVLEDGRHHTFAQFGSGTLVPGCRTHLSRFMLVNPIFMQSEEEHLQTLGVTDAFDRMTVEGDALVTTPFHVSANRCREMVRDVLFNQRPDTIRGVWQKKEGRHGSCGMGIGETVSDSLEYRDQVIRVKDLDDEGLLRRKLEWHRETKLRRTSEEITHIPISPDLALEYGILSDKYIVDKIVARYLAWRARVRVVDKDYLPGVLQDPKRTAIFEGAQGVLLDENLGFHPHTTWTTTTFQNADELLKGTDCEVTRIGVLRAYHTRHGIGPFPTEDEAMTRELTELHNETNPYQNNFRIGPFDTILLRYALRATVPVDELTVTCLDRLPGTIRVCTKYSTLLSEQFETFEPRMTGTLRGQEMVGRILGSVQPVYETLPDQDAFIQHVEAEAGCPVRTCSYGPKATDKKTR